MFKSFLCFVASGAILLGLSGRAVGRDMDLCGGDTLLAELENEKALRAFQRCLAKAATLKERAAIHLYLGIAQLSLLRESDAEEEFRTALTLDPAVRLPPMISPETKDAFLKVKKEHVPPLVPPTSPPAPPARGDPSPPGGGAPPPAPRGQTNWADWITAGVGLAAALAGGGLYIANDAHQDQINDLSLSYQEGTSHRDTASSLALAGNIAMGVAAASAILAVTFFWTGGEPASRETAALSRAARLVMGGVRW